MISTIYWINEIPEFTNQLGTMARPRGGDWLDDEIRSLQMRGVDCLVCLLESSEIWELDLTEEEQLCMKWNIEWIGFPIKDVSIPENKSAFLSTVEELTQKVKAGKSVVVHCRMGIGRSSLIAAAVLMRLGVESEHVFEVISKYRNLKVPDTEEQKAWLLNLAAK